MNAQQLIGVNVVDVAQGSTVGKVSGFMINPIEKRLVAVAVSGKGLFARKQFIRLEDISSIEHDVITITATNVLRDQRDIAQHGMIESITGRRVITEDGRELGNIDGYDINSRTGEIESLTFSASKEALGGIWSTAGESYTIPRPMIRTLGENVVVDKTVPDNLGIRKAA